MASRRTYRSSRPFKNKDYGALVTCDVLCPICRSIFLEPVSLPCKHSFCYSCFEGTVENANLVCPLCRTRIGSWIRKAKKEGKLVNDQLWQAIKDQFSQQIKNRLNGIDEDLQEEPQIIVSSPGEIRKEYELHKQKEEEEIRKKRETELKASEELIKKLKEEEEYRKAVIEEKLRLDEQVAKKLAEEFAFNSPSTSKAITVKKIGPMDRFVKKDNETVTSQYQIKSTNNFADKEYTCKVLLQGDKPKSLSPFIRKRIQQIQKIAEADANSDGSDCIESEMRYFKPIDHRTNPPSQGKSPIKIPCRRPFRNGPPTILSPAGLINFHSNLLESAFTRISLSVPTAFLYRESRSPQDIVSVSRQKRSLTLDPDTPNKKLYRREESDNERRSPIFGRNLKPRKTILDLRKCGSDDSSSPPFYGFKVATSDVKSEIAKKPKRNGIVNQLDDELGKKLLQEKADLEFAKKLQEELNRSMHNTRSSRRTFGTNKSQRRQTTLDELLNKNPYQIK